MTSIKELLVLSRTDHQRLTLALLNLRGVGSVTARALAACVDAVPSRSDELAEKLTSHLPKPRGFKGVTAQALDDAFRAADAQMKRCAELKINIAVDQTSPFSASLWTIPRPPAVLYYKGDDKAAAQLGIAVIGTRAPTEFGYKSATKIAERCCKEGFTVISGLAVGCDTGAHEGALVVSGRTIAVLGHGLDHVYPSSNTKLAKRILDTGGLLVSEYPPGTEPRPNQLIERDRLQAGLSVAVIVVETDTNGGTMQTAGFAIKQHRKLAAIAHPSQLRDAPTTRGNQQLILSGEAVPLHDANDLRMLLTTLAASSCQLPSPG